MTNLLAAIFFTVTTNWVTISTEYPSYDGIPAGQLVYMSAIAHQSGVVTSNTVAKISWEGKAVEVVLSSEEIGRLTRSVNADHLNSGWIK